jgi:hypothetical protein
MQPVSVDAVLLRGALPDLRLRIGAMLAGRVVERHEGHGLLNLSGAVLVARLPPGVEAGMRLRLAVHEVTPEQVVLRIVPDAAPPAPPASAHATLGLPLPDGTRARVSVADRGGEGEEADGTSVVTLNYDSPRLGRLELRLVLGPEGLRADVGAPAGEAAALAGEHAPRLREALRRALGGPVEVRVGARQDRVDLRA